MSGQIRVPGISRLLSLSEPIANDTPHFNWGEATKNGTRIPQSEAHTVNIIKIARRMEMVRSMFGGNSITVTSWYRDPVSNRRVGGASQSQHLSGNAIDFNINGYSPKEVQKTLDPIWEGGIGYGQTFTHLDLRGYRARFNY
jgi:uncharacterized protein YcbK (DUF882 family)